MVNNKKDLVVGVQLDQSVNDGVPLKPDVNVILKKHNSSIEIIIGKLLPGLDATRDIKDRDGDLIETVPDWTSRTKVGTLILTAAGLMKTGGDNNINIGVSESKKEAEAAFKRWRGNGNG